MRIVEQNLAMSRFKSFELKIPQGEHDMTISLTAEVAWCLCAMLLVPLPVRAEGGQINFSGAIAESTCSAVAEESMTVTSVTPTTGGETRQICTMPGNAATVAASRFYALTIVRLSSSVPDRVLKYFDAYTKASQSDAVDPVLLTQTYE
jgi:hypothetical protein